MASSEDRPIIVSGGDQMVTVKLPRLTSRKGEEHRVKALPAVGPFKMIVFTNTVTGEVQFRAPAAGNWAITIE